MKTTLRDLWHFIASTSTYIPHLNSPFRLILKRKRSLWKRIDATFCPEKILDEFQLFLNERIVEIPFVYRTLDLIPDHTVLEFGCSNSRLSIELASIGLNMTGIDLRPYPFHHPKFSFIQGDFFDQAFSGRNFDAVIAISAVEHVGLGAYGEEEKKEGADRLLVNEFFRILKPNGQLIITLPFGEWNVNSFYRIYDIPRLGKLLEDFRIERDEYYQRVNYDTWERVTADELARFRWRPVVGGSGAEGVALISARKK